MGLTTSRVINAAAGVGFLLDTACAMLSVLLQSLFRLSLYFSSGTACAMLLALLFVIWVYSLCHWTPPVLCFFRTASLGLLLLLLGLSCCLPPWWFRVGTPTCQGLHCGSGFAGQKHQGLQLEGGQQQSQQHALQTARTPACCRGWLGPGSLAHHI